MDKELRKNLLFYHCQKIFGLWFFLLWLRPKYRYVGEGCREAVKPLRRKGGCVLAAPHYSFADGLYFNMVFPLRTTFILGADDIELPKKVEWISKKMLCVDINRDKFFYSSFKKVSKLLKAGYVLSICGEGKINEHPFTVEDFKSGPVLFASANRVPVVPVFVYRGRETRNRVFVYFGRPIEFPEDRYSKEETERISAELTERVRGLAECFRRDTGA